MLAKSAFQSFSGSMNIDEIVQTRDKIITTPVLDRNRILNHKPTIRTGMEFITYNQESFKSSMVSHYCLFGDYFGFSKANVFFHFSYCLTEISEKLFHL